MKENTYHGDTETRRRGGTEKKKIGRRFALSDADKKLRLEIIVVQAVRVAESDIESRHK